MQQRQAARLTIGDGEVFSISLSIRRKVRRLGHSYRVGHRTYILLEEVGLKLCPAQPLA